MNGLSVALNLPEEDQTGLLSDFQTLDLDPRPILVGPRENVLEYQSLNEFLKGCLALQKRGMGLFTPAETRNLLKTSQEVVDRKIWKEGVLKAVSCREFPVLTFWVETYPLNMVSHPRG